MSFNAGQVLAYLPMMILIGMGCVVLLAETFVSGARRSGLAWLGVAGCVAALAAVAGQWDDAAQPQIHFMGMLVLDRMALFLDGTFIVAGLVTLLFAGPFLREQGFEFGEFYAMVLFAVAGMMMVSHATHLVSLLIGIETMSLAAYVLTGCWRRNLRSSEGAMKYFLMGAFATGFLVYGIALVYGTTGGEMSYAGINAKVGEASKAPMFFLGEYFILIALAFKVAAVPFHMWAPDTYEGAPTPVTGFMAAGVKAAAFGGILRLFGTAFSNQLLVFDITGWASVLSVLAALTMTLGNLAALRQENIKRLLAYSSIAHAGYLLIGVVAVGVPVAGAQASVLFYLVAYTFTTLGAFGVVAWIGNRKDERLFVDDWAGMASARPGVALAMTIFLLSLGGVPPTGGFFAKFYLFRAAMESPQLYWLVVVGVLNSIVSIYYYLRIVVAMYFRDALRPLHPIESPSMHAGLVITAVAVVLLGLFPGSVVEWAGPASASGVAVTAVAK
ncbi:MAG TPA: NADH-quinone oxidoreductase subunit N [Polyangia bacterium]|jgi:NADH-quinone oxidoreductase subunit N|nr:NADH-quinone oxidoreductase subunit N [Polyangia bacterium]